MFAVKPEIRANEVIYGKLKAATVHSLATLLVAVICAGLVFWLWYPDPFYSMLGGLELFFLVAVVDLVLGPLLSLVIYTPKKPRAVLLRDYSVIGLIQASALVYGMYTVAISRPVFVVFAVDGYEVVLADDLRDEDLAAAARPQWKRRSWTGPQYVWAPMPEDPKERTELIFSALSGRDIQFLPKYYRDLAEGEDFIVGRGRGISDFIAEYPEQEDVIKRAGAQMEKSEKSLAWLPVRSFKGVWAVAVDRQTLKPLQWLPLESY